MPFFAGLILGLGALVLIIIFGTFAGAFTAWIVGWFFGDTILGILNQMGIHGFQMWQIGGFLGFISGFFNRTVQSTKD